MKEIFENGINNVKHKLTILPIALDVNSQKMRTFNEKYYFCTLK